MINGKLRLLHDWVMIELEPARTETKGGIFLTGPEPVRIAKATSVGPKVKDLKVGDRFPFFKALTDTGSNKSLAARMPENVELIKESDVLFIIEEGELEVTV